MSENDIQPWLSPRPLPPQGLFLFCFDPELGSGSCCPLGWLWSSFRHSQASLVVGWVLKHCHEWIPKGSHVSMFSSVIKRSGQRHKVSLCVCVSVISESYCPSMKCVFQLIVEELESNGSSWLYLWWFHAFDFSILLNKAVKKGDKCFENIK